MGTNVVCARGYVVLLLELLEKTSINSGLKIIRK
jgi:hypothetical protein